MAKSLDLIRQEERDRAAKVDAQSKRCPAAICLIVLLSAAPQRQPDNRSLVYLIDISS
jgi:hypothetical protein